MTRTTDTWLAATAPAIWGSTYIVTTLMLPDGYPLTIAMLRALPAGLILLVLVRQLPPVEWLGKVMILGALNFTIFWALLFVAAYRLPGGVAATLGAVQPLVVLALSSLLLGVVTGWRSVVAALAGLVGVGLLVLGPKASLDLIGVGAALGGALSMAAGVVLTRKWQPPVPPLVFTAWQLTAGGLLLLPLSLMIEPGFPFADLTRQNLLGLIWLGLFGAALTYFFWFRGIARLGPTSVTMLGFLSPVTAVFLGWAILGQSLSLIQSIGTIIILASIRLGTKSQRGIKP
ncbi:EamA family transporter [Cognatishimia sp.]|uniref:EamA family transporter n=1 Tax=Cognatishimia sp. TaxID=2211648 RepID=UPI003513E08A|nr:EamA family transporter [Cognatishimia sp.]